MIEISHHVVERLRIVGLPSNVEIEQQTEQLALVVVRDLRVHRILIRPILFDPGIETGVFRAHLQTARRVLKSLDLLSQRLQIIAIRNQPGAQRHQVAVVIGDAFGDPQIAGVVLFRVIEWPERVRANSLHVPEMKEFMRDQTIETRPAALS